MIYKKGTYNYKMRKIEDALIILTISILVFFILTILAYIF